MTKKKRLSLADRIIAENKSNTPEDEKTKEQTILSVVTSSVKDQTIERQSNKISEQQSNRAIELQNNKTSEQQDNRTTEQPSNSTTGQINTRTIEHLPEQVLEQQNNETTGQVDNLTPTQQDNRTIEQLHTGTTTHKSNKTSEQQSDRTTAQVGIFDLNSKPSNLNLNQYRILYELYFNRPFKVKGPLGLGTTKEYPIAYGTVRNSLRSLEKKGYISKPFSINDGVTKGTTCQVNEKICTLLFGTTHVLNSEQQDNRTPAQQGAWTTTQQNISTTGHQHNRTNEQQSKKASEQLNPSNKLVSKYLNKLTNYIENSDFWKKEGLSEKKCGQWLDEFEFLKNDPDLLVTQLMFAENTKSVLEPKTKTPVHVFYGCLKNGGLTRPKHFLFPDEKALKIRQQELQIKEKLLADQAAIREKEIKIADELAFNGFMENKENVEFLISEIEKTFVTPKKKNSIEIYRKGGQIDSTLYNALKNEFGKTED